jgi:hypothetical protein
VIRHRGFVPVASTPILMSEQFANLAGVKTSAAGWTLNDVVRFGFDRRASTQVTLLHPS